MKSHAGRAQGKTVIEWTFVFDFDSIHLLCSSEIARTTRDEGEKRLKCSLAMNH